MKKFNTLLEEYKKAEGSQKNSISNEIKNFLNNDYYSMDSALSMVEFLENNPQLIKSDNLIQKHFTKLMDEQSLFVYERLFKSKLPADLIEEYQEYCLNNVWQLTPTELESFIDNYSKLIEEGRGDLNNSLIHLGLNAANDAQKNVINSPELSALENSNDTNYFYHFNQAFNMVLHTNNAAARFSGAQKLYNLSKKDYECSTRAYKLLKSTEEDLEVYNDIINHKHKNSLSKIFKSLSNEIEKGE